MFCPADCSNWQEFLGNLNGTRVAFGEAHACEGHDWKVCLENPLKDLLVPAVVTCLVLTTSKTPWAYCILKDLEDCHFFNHAQIDGTLGIVLQVIVW